MGYYSEVALALTGKGARFLEQAIDDIAFGDNLRAEVVRLFDSADVSYVDSQDGAKCWYWSFIKWYDDFKEIEFVEKLMLDMHTRDYLFIRIGEYYEDIEEKGLFHDNSFGIGVIRSISISEPSKPIGA